MSAPAELSPRTRTLVYGALTLQTLISAGTYLAAKRAMGELSPFTLVLLRFFLSGAVFALVLAVVPGPKLPPRAAWGKIAWLGLLAGPVNQGLLQPVATALAAWALLGELLTWEMAVGGVLVIVGVRLAQ